MNILEKIATKYIPSIAPRKSLPGIEKDSIEIMNKYLRKGSKSVPHSGTLLSPTIGIQLDKQKDTVEEASEAMIDVHERTQDFTTIDFKLIRISVFTKAATHPSGRT